MTGKVIIITDGDVIASQTVEKVSRRLGCRFISRSAGNPTPLSGPVLVELIKKAPQQPVIVLLDDRGNHNIGQGEEALLYLAGHPDIELLGVVAVASDIEGVQGTPVDLSVTQHGHVHQGVVNKNGKTIPGKYLQGDTVSVLPELNIPLIVGTGDTGKMAGHDAKGKVTLKAVELILDHARTIGILKKR